MRREGVLISSAGNDGGRCRASQEGMGSLMH